MQRSYVCLQDGIPPLVSIRQKKECIHHYDSERGWDLLETKRRRNNHCCIKVAPILGGPSCRYPTPGDAHHADLLAQSLSNIHNFIGISCEFISSQLS